MFLCNSQHVIVASNNLLELTSERIEAAAQAKQPDFDCKSIESRLKRGATCSIYHLTTITQHQRGCKSPRPTALLQNKWARTSEHRDSTRAELSRERRDRIEWRRYINRNKRVRLNQVAPVKPSTRPSPPAIHYRFILRHGWRHAKQHHKLNAVLCVKYACSQLDTQNDCCERFTASSTAHEPIQTTL